jgi:hypothetical protein
MKTWGSLDRSFSDYLSRGNLGQTFSPFPLVS